MGVCLLIRRRSRRKLGAHDYRVELNLSKKAKRRGGQEEVRTGQRSTREVVMILNFPMSVWYPPCVSVSVPSVYTSIDETGHGKLTNGIHFQFPSIVGTGLFDGAY